jgi:hypothetical protein
MSLITTIVLSVQVSDSAQIPKYNGYAGFELQLTVKEVTNITDRIFVLHREPTSEGVDGYEDAFYSIASVTELSDLPADNPDVESPFFRVNSVALVFPTKQALDEGLKKILAEVEALKKANDVSINFSEPTLVMFPLDAISRYYGPLSTTTATDEQLLSLTSDAIFDKAISTSITIDGLKYIYFAYRAELGVPTLFKINSATVTPTLVTRAVVDQNGHSASYNIYRSPSTVSGPTATLDVS